jgi:hypothetical protein
MTTIHPADGMTFWHVNEYYGIFSDVLQPVVN